MEGEGIRNLMLVRSGFGFVSFENILWKREIKNFKYYKIEKNYFFDLSI